MKNFIFYCYDNRQCHKRYKGYKKSNEEIINTDDLNQSILTDCLNDSIKKKSTSKNRKFIK